MAAISLSENIVITGMSGQFPESSNIQEFKENLFNHVDMVTIDDKRPSGLYGLPYRHGKLKDLSRFDANFFAIHAKQAEVMCPQLRLLLETTFEAILDAGINPEEIKGSRTGVFISISASESGEHFAAAEGQINECGSTEIAQSTFPHRLSCAFDFKGPSFVTHPTSSNSLLAFHEAILSIRAGKCDAAIVGGTNVNFKLPQFNNVNTILPDGACEAFGDFTMGCIRSEACVVVLLQKAKNAKRIYASVINTGSNKDGFKSQEITFPNREMQKEFVEKVYKEAGISPYEVSYVEAHGIGTEASDPREVNNITDIFCKGRSSPLLVGSVKSNMGYSGPASGLCSLVKVLIAMEAGSIPANLNFMVHNEGLAVFKDGRLTVVSKNSNWNGGLAAINSLGFSGSNVHVILKSHYKHKQAPIKDNIPRLVCLSGRSREGVNKVLDKLETMPRDDDFITLMHDIHKKNVSGHNYRGFTVLGASTPIRGSSENKAKQEVWFVFPGMGSKWEGMGRALMELEPFRKTIDRCAAALANEGLDLLYLINHGTEETFENVLNCVISIICIQVAFFDVLTAIGIKPDKIIGHSVGELCCSYADGTFTVEQTALAAYWRGKSVLDSKLIKGGMAVVGLTWEEAKKRVPSNIFAACHNGEHSVSVSGPESDIDAFILQLQKEGIFARKARSSGVAFHSKYIYDAAPKLRSSMEKIIPVPKPRSKCWISSSVPEESWGSQLAASSSAAYHVNNFLSPVLFYDVVMKIPENSLVIEIAPHALLNSIIQKSIPKSCTILSLTEKGLPDELSNFMANIGKIYLDGQQPDLSVFHKPTSYPVARNTPMISPLVEWDHSVKYPVANFSGKEEYERA